MQKLSPHFQSISNLWSWQIHTNIVLDSRSILPLDIYFKRFWSLWEERGKFHSLINFSSKPCCCACGSLSQLFEWLWDIPCQLFWIYPSSPSFWLKILPLMCLKHSGAFPFNTASDNMIMLQANRMCRCKILCDDAWRDMVVGGGWKLIPM